jgi:uncharacterized membrane protein YoaK (UPF0700 family)
VLYLTILLLSVVGGGVDAIIIQGFGVLTAAQTGNTILMVVALAGGRSATGFLAATSVIAYIAGTVVGELVLLGRISEPWRRPLRRALLAELTLLISLLMSWHLVGNHPNTPVTAALVTLASISMGIQSAAVLNLHAGPTTTYMTGTLTSFGTGMVRGASHLFSRQRDSTSPKLTSRHGPAFYGLDWLAYGCGALAGAVLFQRFRETALVLPVVVLVAAILASLTSGPDGLE